MVECQVDLKYSEYLGKNSQGLHYFDIKSIFKENKISEDFGPRAPHNGQFHGGIDYNSRGTGDQDLKDLLHSIEDGTIYEDDGVVQNSYSKFLTIIGDNNVRYIHVFEDFSLPSLPTDNQYNFGGTFVKFIDNAQTRRDWAIIFAQNGIYSAIGPTGGNVTFTDELGTIRSIAVSNSVSEENPVAALGNSKNFVGAGHLHLELLTQLTKSNGNPVYPGDDLFAKNPLGIINHTTPNYCIKLLKQDDQTEGIELRYPGTEKLPLQVRIALHNQQNCNHSNSYLGLNRYNETMNVEYLNFYIKSDLIPNWQILRGEDESVGISLGGYPGLNVFPSAMHNNGHVGSFDNIDGVYTEAYNSNPFDDYYVKGLISRLHKGFPNNNRLISDSPAKVQYNDGDYKIKPSITDIKIIRHDGNEFSFKLDNFLPFISKLSVAYTSGSNIIPLATVRRNQNEGVATTNNDGFIKIGTSYSRKPRQLGYGLFIEITTSEPMDVLRCSVSQHSSAYQNMTRSATDPLVWTLIFSVAPTHPINRYDLSFTGVDKSNNKIVNVSSLTNGNKNENQCPIYYRTGSTTWSGSPAQGQDTFVIPIDPTCSNNLTTDLESRSSQTTPPCFFESEEDFDDSNLWSVQSSSCGATITLINTQVQDLELNWIDHPEWQNLKTIQIYEAGSFCYKFKDPVTCCTLEGCLFIAPEELNTLIPMTLTDDYSVVSGMRCDRRNGGSLDLSSSSFIANGVGPYILEEIRNGVEYQTFDLSYNVFGYDSILLRVTDSRGCTAYKNLIIPYDFPEIDGIAKHDVCTSQDNGIIELHLSQEITNNNDVEIVSNFNDGPDEIYSPYDGLVVGPPGMYKFYIRNKDNHACRSTTLMEEIKDLSSDPPLVRNLVTSNQCGNQLGSLTVNVSQGAGNYSISLTGNNKYIPIKNNQPVSLAIGLYNLQIIDACGNEIKESVTIDGKLETEIVPYIEECMSAGEASHVLVKVNGDYPPFSILWDNGDTTPMTTKQTFNIRKVVVTDSRGCSVRDTSDTNYDASLSSRVAIVTTPTCPLSSDGTATFTIQNLQNEIVRVFFNNIELISPSTESVITYTINNMNSVEKHYLGVQFGNCDPFRFPFTIGEKTLIEISKRLFADPHTNAIMCEYDVFCEGQLLYSNLTKPVTPEKEGLGSAPSCGEWVYRCGDLELRRDIKHSWLTGVEARALQESRFGISNTLINNDCAKFRVCEDGRVNGGGNNLLGCNTTANVISLGDRCFRIECTCFFHFFGLTPALTTFCVDNLTPELMIVEDATNNRCIIKSMMGYRYFGDLGPILDADPRYANSTLKNFIDNNQSRTEFKCAEIRYCEYPDRLELLRTNIDAVDCSPLFTENFTIPRCVFLRSIDTTAAEDAIACGGFWHSLTALVKKDYDDDHMQALYPDLTPVITLAPNVIQGVTEFNLTVRVSEINDVSTNGPIIVEIPKDIRISFKTPFNQELTSLGFDSLNNNQWVYSQNENFHIFTSTTSISGSMFSTFGFVAIFDPRNTKGVFTFTSQIVGGSGGENKTENNVDSEKIDYFID
jgi:hypothetical protein